MPPETEPPELSVVVPCFNEAAGLEGALTSIAACLSERPGQSEIIVVDDGSEDGTADAARAHPAGAEVIRLDVNQGKGAAVREGMLAARGRRILFTDADLSTPLAELAALEAALTAGADVAIGSRAIDRSRIAVRQSWVRDRLGRTFNLAIRVLGVRGFADTQCGFKLFTRRAAREVFSRVKTRRWAFDVEAVHLAVRLGFDVVEVPVRWSHVEDSRVSVLRDALGTLRDLLLIRWRCRGVRRLADDDRA